jgi:hypothetical protein
MRGATILKATDDKTRELNKHNLVAFSGEAGDTGKGVTDPSFISSIFPIAFHFITFPSRFLPKLASPFHPKVVSSPYSLAPHSLSFPFYFDLLRKALRGRFNPRRKMEQFLV